MTSRDYFEHVDRLRAKFMEELAGEYPLPEFLVPENPIISDELRAHSKKIRETALRGDFAAIRETLHDHAGAGFNRSEEEEDKVSGLDEARRRVDERIEDEERHSDEDDADRDRGDGAP